MFFQFRFGRTQRQCSYILQEHHRQEALQLGCTSPFVELMDQIPKITVKMQIHISILGKQNVTTDKASSKYQTLSKTKVRFVCLAFVFRIADTSCFSSSHDITSGALALTSSSLGGLKHKNQMTSSELVVKKGRFFLTESIQNFKKMLEISNMYHLTWRIHRNNSLR